MMQFRARLKSDLEALIEKTGIEVRIIETPHADYRWRFICEPQMAVGLMIQLTAGIDYTNFKNEVHNTPGQESKAVPYMRIWSVMAGLQDGTHGRAPEPTVLIDQPKARAKKPRGTG